MNDELWKELVRARINYELGYLIYMDEPIKEQDFERDFLDDPSMRIPLMRLHRLMKKAGYKTLSDMPHLGMIIYAEETTGLKLSQFHINIWIHHCKEIIEEEREFASEKTGRRMFIIAITATAAAVLSVLSPAITALINYFLE